MKVPEFIENLLKQKGIDKLNPVQEMAIEAGLLNGENILISSPTASGKTLIAEIAIINAIKNSKRAVYIAPMRALISEKFEEFKSDHPNIKVGLFMGEYDEYEYDLNRYDVIFASTEKFDSMLRNYNLSNSNIGCIVYDEIHMLGDRSRGSTLEFVITMNKLLFPKSQIIGLSATISNGEEISAWLNSKFIYSDFRPVKLNKMIYLDGELIGEHTKKLKNIVNDPLINIVMNLIEEKKQALIFNMNKKSTVSTSKIIGDILSNKLTENEKIQLNKISKEILNVLDKPTEQCENLAEVVKNGSAFHHAGLLNKQRKIIEDAFKSGYIKFICATPTLALGVNLPANTVIISSIYRYDLKGMSLLPKMEVEQMLGRAGRPKYDKEGNGIIIARNEREFDLINSKYINGDLERITSSFVDYKTIERYVLTLICTGTFKTKEDILNFLNYTFAAHLGADFDLYLDDALDFLQSNKLITDESPFEPTKLGKLINSLYLDPETGILFNSFLESKSSFSEFETLHIISMSGELDVIHMSQKEYEKYEEESYQYNFGFENIMDYERFVTSITLAHILQDWINDKPSIQYFRP